MTSLQPALSGDPIVTHCCAIPTVICTCLQNLPLSVGPRRTPGSGRIAVKLITVPRPASAQQVRSGNTRLAGPKAQ